MICNLPMSIRFQCESALASRQYALNVPGVCNVKAVRIHCCACPEQRTARKPISGVHLLPSHRLSQPHNCSPQASPTASKLLYQSDSHQSPQVAVAGQAWAEATGLISQYTQCQLPSLKRWADECRSIAAVCVSCIVSLLAILTLVHSTFDKQLGQVAMPRAPDSSVATGIAAYLSCRLC